MSVFNIPKEVDEFLTLGFLILFLLSFMINTHQCGKAAVGVIEDNYHLSNVTINYSFDYSPDGINNMGISYIDMTPDMFLYEVERYSDMSLRNSKYAFSVTIFLYWFALPFLCYYYAFFKFKPSMWENPNI